jgi:hypothetical protein
MSNPNQTITAAASHSEIVSTALQVLTIAALGLFSVLSLLNVASQIV